MLKKNCYTPYTTKELKPAGWLKEQLRIQADGLSGHLDLVWPDIRDSQWIGGDKEGWERVPYWLDGFIPLAYLLDDEELKERAKRYIDAILERQQEDGWICPCTEEERGRYDVWAVFLICKVLALYQDCSEDIRAEEAIYCAMKQLYRHIENHTLFDWAMMRWYEGLVSLFWLYDRRPEAWILELAERLGEQGFDYAHFFRNWRLQKPAEHGRWDHMSHVVNLAMSLKAGALCSKLDGSDGNELAKLALSLLQRDHGMATGHFTGDECLSGTSPIQGSECCSVVEAMYSYETLLAVTGDSFWSDILERIAYNALPATLSPDMWTHQYDQQTNQVQCSILPKEHIVFRTNNEEANLFGLEPHFGCCTANFNQGWPKFALSSMMKSDDGIAITVIAPSVLDTEVVGVAVKCTIETEYPFRNKYRVIIETGKPVEFTLHLRFPVFAEGVLVDGKAAESNCIHRVWDGKDTVTVTMLVEPHVTTRPNDMVCVWRGPLLYSVKIGEDWVKHEYTRDKVERKFPYCDYEVFPTTKWAYGLTSEDFVVEEKPLVKQPFAPEDAPVCLKAQMAPIDWEIENGICKEQPESRAALENARTVELIPYGCTNLRLTEFPFLDK